MKDVATDNMKSTSMKRSLFKKVKKKNKPNLKKSVLKRQTDNSSDSDSERNFEIKTEPDADGTAAGLIISVKDETHNGDDINHNEEEEESTLTKLMSLKYKRQIKLKSMRGGTDISTLLRSKTNFRDHHMNGDDDENEAETEVLLKEANKDLKERLAGTFGTSTSGGGQYADDAGGGGDGEDGDNGSGVLGKKHRLAMEEFIQNQMSLAGSSNTNDSNSAVSDSSNHNTNRGVGTKEDIYAQLLAGELQSGPPDSNASQSSSLPSSSQVGNNNSAQEADVGAGGAMLGGTGIAEVTLPVEERIRAVKETELAAVQREKARRGVGARTRIGALNDGVSIMQPQQDFSQLLPISFDSGPGKKRRRPNPSDMPVSTSTSANTKTYLETTTTAVLHPQKIPTEPTAATDSSNSYTASASSAGTNVLNRDVSNLGSSYAHNFRLHTHEWVSKKKEQQESELESIRKQKELEEGTAVNRTRVGFEVKRKGGAGPAMVEGSTNIVGEAGGRQHYHQGTRSGDDFQRGQQKSSDDRLWRTFVSRQRERGGGRR